MSDSLIVNLADAVVEQINSAPEGTFSETFTAARHYRPEFELKELSEVRVSVVPRKIDITNISRQANQYDVAIDVAVQKKVNAADLEQLDALMALVEQIADIFRLRRVPLPDGSALWGKTENDPVFAPEHLETKQVFTSVLTLTFRIAR